MESTISLVTKNCPDSIFGNRWFACESTTPLMTLPHDSSVGHLLFKRVEYDSYRLEYVEELQSQFRVDYILCTKKIK